MSFEKLTRLARQHMLSVNVHSRVNGYKIELMWLGYPSHMIDHGMIYSVCGKGTTLDEAAEDFCINANNKTLVFSPYELNRREVPFTIN